MAFKHNVHPKAWYAEKGFANADGSRNREHFLYFQFLKAKAAGTDAEAQPLATPFTRHVSSLFGFGVQDAFKKAVEANQTFWTLPGQGGCEYESGDFHSSLTTNALRTNMRAEEMTVTVNTDNDGLSSIKDLFQKDYGVTLPTSFEGWVGVIAPKTQMQAAKELVADAAANDCDSCEVQYMKDEDRPEPTYYSHRGFGLGKALATLRLPEDQIAKKRDSGQLTLGWGELYQGLMVFTDKAAYQQAKVMLGLEKPKPQAAPAPAA